MSNAAQSDFSSAPTDQGRSLFWFAATTLLGAFLVFQVQSVISKCVLPWFGGTPAVWTTCMLFFQLLLFGGYLYAHLLRTFVGPAMQGVIHLVLMSIAALMLPIEPNDAWKPTGSESPTLYLLWMLAAHVGLPYFVLSSTGPLLQAWLSYQDDSQRVYRLYALSNAGSLLALLSYPFVVEPVLSVTDQSMLWSLMFCGFVLLQGFIAAGLFHFSKSIGSPKTPRQDPGGGDVSTTSIGWQTRTAWIGLPALASTTLLVVTNHVCQDIAVIPFLWVLPLSLYLLSFIVCFDSPQWYRPKLIATATLIAIVAIQTSRWLPLAYQLIAEASLYMLTLLGVCLLCHGEVARIKPPASKLTQYYALLSLGGALGGIIVALVCPLLFDTFFELPLIMGIVTVLAGGLFLVCKDWQLPVYDWSITRSLRVPAVLMIAAPVLIAALSPQDQTIASERNFFGVLAVLKDDQGIRLVHGRTIHGMQLNGDRRHQATTYYGRQSGVGKTIRAMQAANPGLQIGVVGLGCGVLASYGRASDQFDIIEINPAVIDIANKHFTFLADSKATIRNHLGDGRLVLERMTEKKFDLLVLDAFSSDAIPAHLLTRQAIDLYQSRLAEEGVLAVHVSNNVLDLVPLVHRLAADGGMHSRLIQGQADPNSGEQPSLWVLLAGETHPIWQTAAFQDAQIATSEELETAPLWTDEQHNLVSVLRLW